MKHFQTLALITIWAASAVGAIMLNQPGVYVAAVAGTAIWALAICNGF